MNSQNIPQGWPGYGAVPQGVPQQGQMPGQVPGQFGGMPGQVPGAMGGQMPGQYPGQMPGQQFAQQGMPQAAYPQGGAQFPQQQFGAQQGAQGMGVPGYGAQVQPGMQPGQFGAQPTQAMQGQYGYGQTAQFPGQMPGQMPQQAQAAGYPDQTQQMYGQPAQGQFGADATQAMPYYPQLDTMDASEQNPMQSALPSNDGRPLSMSIVAIAATVLGAVALGTSWLDVVCFASLVVGAFGLIFGIAGIVNIVRHKAKGMPFAIAGVVLSLAAIVIVVLTQFVFPGALSGLFGGDETPQSTTVNVDVDVNENVNSNVTQPSGSSSVFGPPAQGGGEPAADAATSAYAVKIDKLEQVTDVDGKPAIMVTYTWTNNSDEPTMFLAAISTRALQSGVELQTALVQGGDPAASTAEVAPGQSAVVTEAYALRDTSDVTIECTDMFSMDEIIIADRIFKLNTSGGAGGGAASGQGAAGGSGASGTAGVTGSIV